MRAAISGRCGTEPVRMSAAQFETLAVLIERLAERCGADDDTSPGRSSRGGGAASEFRSWVPLQLFAQAQRRIALCEAEVLEARSQLASREAENIRLTSLAFGVHSAR